MKAFISLTCHACEKHLKTSLVDTAEESGWKVEQLPLIQHQASCPGEPQDPDPGRPFLGRLCACSHMDVQHLEDLYHCSWLYCNCPMFQSVKTT